MNDLQSLLPEPRRLAPERVAQTRRLLEAHVASDHPVANPTAPPRRRFTKPALAVVGAAAGLTALNLALSPSAAYGSWTASPNALVGDDLRTLGKSCATTVGDRFSNARRDLQPVVGERRGSFQTALVAAHGQVALCADWLGAPDGDSTRGSSLSGLVLDARLPAGRDLALLAVPGQVGGDDAARIAFGLVGPGVKSVTIETSDGTRLTASVSGGYFIGWWPSGAEPRTVTAVDASGRVLDRSNGVGS